MSVEEFALLTGRTATWGQFSPQLSGRRFVDRVHGKVRARRIKRTTLNTATSQQIAVTAVIVVRPIHFLPEFIDCIAQNSDFVGQHLNSGNKF